MPTRNQYSLNIFFRNNPGKVGMFRSLEKCYKKVHRIKGQLKFLKNCFDDKIVPKTLIPYRLRNKQIPFGKIEEGILEQHIQNAKDDLSTAYFMLRKTKREITQVLSFDNYNYMYELVKFVNKNSIQKNLDRLQRKYMRLFKNSIWVKCSNYNKNVVNLSDYHPNYDEIIALGYGLKFAFKLFHPLDIEAISNLLKGTKSTSDCNFSFLSGLILAGNKSKNNNVYCWPKRLVTAIEGIRKNRNLKITKSDKTNQIVILNKTTYMNKANDLLSDDITYEKLTSNPIKNKTTSFNKKIREIFSKIQDRELKDTMIKKFSLVTPRLPYFYGLPKTTKESIPLRPVISNCNSYGTKLSNYLSKKLEPMVGKISDSHVLNAMDFKEKVKNLSITGRLLSLDVNSLFTKVPVDETIDFIRRKLPLMDLDLPFSNEIFIELLELSTTGNVFQFEGKYYRQKSGMAMGSSLSPIMSNIFMEYFETELLPNITQKKWLRYVDDIFISWPDNEDFDNFLNILNDLHQNITFKYEFEMNGSLPFLDLRIHRNDNTLSYSVYRKETNSLSYIHFLSAHQESIKKSVISGQFLRSYRLCDQIYLKNEIQFIYRVFRDLGYPNAFIHKCHSVAKRKFFGNSDRIQFNQDSLNIISLPYNRNLENIKKDLRKTGFEVVFNYPSVVSKSIIRNSPGSLHESYGTYEINCNNCNEKYYGETGRTLEQRIKEHKRDVRNGNTNNAMFVHIMNKSHSINWNSAKLIYKCSDYYKRRIVESTMINSFPNMNISGGSFKLNNMFNGIILSNINYKY